MGGFKSVALNCHVDGSPSHDNGSQGTEPDEPASNEPMDNNENCYANQSQHDAPPSGPSTNAPCLCGQPGCVLVYLGCVSYASLRKKILEERLFELPNDWIVSRRLFRKLYPNGW